MAAENTKLIELQRETRIEASKALYSLFPINYIKRTIEGSCLYDGSTVRSDSSGEYAIWNGGGFLYIKPKEQERFGTLVFINDQTNESIFACQMNDEVKMTTNVRSANIKEILEDVLASKKVDKTGVDKIIECLGSYNSCLSHYQVSNDVLVSFKFISDENGSITIDSFSFDNLRKNQTRG